MFTVGRGQKIMFFATKRIILPVRMTSKMTTPLVLIFNIVFIVLLFWDRCESDKSHLYGIF